MIGGTLVVSKSIKLFPYWKKQLEGLGFANVAFTGEEKDSLNMLINEIKPSLIIVESCFYLAATPYMMGRLHKNFPRLNIAVVNLYRFPVSFAPFFIYRGVKSYVDMQEGMDEFFLGLKEIRLGHTYMSPSVKEIIENNEWADTNDRAEQRQLEILIFLCNGTKPEDIAKNLQISRRTVDWHIEEMFKTFDVQSREELISAAFYLDLVTKDDLFFFDRKNKRRPLPKWADVKIKNGQSANTQKTIRRVS